MSTNTAILAQYHQPLWGQFDSRLRKCLIASSILAVATLIMIYVVPQPEPELTTVDDVPERLARLILQKAAPAPPAIKLPQANEVAETPDVKPKAQPKPPTQVRRTSKPKVAQDKGKAGRTKAQKEITQNLAQVNGSLDKVMDNLSKSLPASENSNANTPKKRRRRGVRSGRNSQQLGAVQGVSTDTAPDVAGSAIEGEGVSIAAITDLVIDDSGGGGGGSTSGSRSSTSSGNGQLRSNESLLAAVRRYAPGIQFCYDNELKKNPSLRGKLVVSITVLANGRVSEAFIVDDTLRSAAVKNCVLSQIKGWQLPAIPEGTVTFKTPFVFTPPE